MKIVFNDAGHILGSAITELWITEGDKTSKLVFSGDLGVENRPILRDLKKAGLKGVECYHPNHSEEEAWKLFQIAAKYHLHVTEGSDFHGKANE